MTDHIVSRLTASLKTDDLDDYTVELLEYGISAMCLNLPKTILVIFICKKLKLLKPLLLIFLFYGAIRNYSHGIHSKTPLACFLIGTANFLSMAYLSTVMTIPKKIYNAIFAYFFCVYLKYAPSGTEVNPMYKDQIKPLKIKSVLLVIIYYFIGLKKGLVRNIAVLSLLSQSISIIPITYKLANQKGGVVHEDEE
ncbi:MAG: accessory gene regulator B family protein [Defluviitaleaceae bacterium]|nr:accessory gene regulator B family protein [Defluviitaleaceae bacterium]